MFPSPKIFDHRSPPAPCSLAFAGHAALPQAVGETPMPTLAPMIKRVSPAVVNIATRGTIRERAPQNPLLEDPFFRRFFDIPDMPARAAVPERRLRRHL